jgi:catechol 2,3-dioxygenase-like lactoylglutathione lyase family enzyme
LEDYRWLRGPLSKPNDTAPRADLALVILAVADLMRSVEFYRRIFDWRQTVETPVYVEFELRRGLGLGLYLREGFARNVGQTPSQVSEIELTSTEIYFRTEEPYTYIARLEQLGARALSPMALRDWGDEAAYFADPDGNVIVVARSLTP